MKKTAVVFFVVLSSMFLLLSCGSTPSSPAATPTATATEIPSNILIDNFNDGNINNMLTTAPAGNWLVFQDAGISLITGGPAISDTYTTGYCLGVSATVNAAINAVGPYYGEIAFGTFLRPTASTTLDMSMMEELTLVQRCDQISIGSGDLEYIIELISSGGDYLTFTVTPMLGNWQPVIIPFTDFTKVGTATLPQILSNLVFFKEIVRYNSGSLYDSAQVAIHIDNVGFSRIP